MKGGQAAAGRNLNRSSQAAHPIDIACLGGLLIVSNVMQNDAITNAQESGNAIWQSVIIACIIGAVLAVLTGIVLRAFLDDTPRDWFDLTRELAGKTGVRIAAIAMFLLFLDTAKITIASMETTAANEYLEKTPIWIVLVVALLVCAIGARRGMRGVVRSARFLLLFNAVIIILILLVAWNAYDPNNLFPILGYGLGTTARVGLSMAGDMYCDMLIVCLILPVQRGQYGVRRGIRLAFGIIVPFLVLLSLGYAMAYPVGGRYLIPPIQQLAIISEFGRYLQRLSPLLVFVWASAFFTSMSSMLFGMARAWAALWGLPDEQPVLWALVALLLVIAFIPYDALAPMLRDRLPGTIRLCLYAVAILPALVGRMRYRHRRMRGETHAA